MELKLENVTKKYGEKVALDGFSYTFTPGIYGILGANGAGKSTRMNLITDNLPRNGGDDFLRRDGGAEAGGGFSPDSGVYDPTAGAVRGHDRRELPGVYGTAEGDSQKGSEGTDSAGAGDDQPGGCEPQENRQLLRRHEAVGDAGLNGQSETHDFVE